MERCPNCRARYESGDSCRRCGMDLGSLLALERAVDAQIIHALGQVARGEVPAGLHTLAQARKLHPTPMTAHLMGFAQDLAGVPERSDRATAQADAAEIAATPAGATTNAVARADLVQWVAWLLIAQAVLIAFLSRLG